MQHIEQVVADEMSETIEDINLVVNDAGEDLEVNQTIANNIGVVTPDENEANAVDSQESSADTKPNAEESRDLILLAALKLFGKKGFFNTSLTEIAKECDLKNVSAIYQHFKSKQAIAQQLYDNILDSLNISIDDIRRRNQKSAEQLRGIVDLLFKLTDEAPDIMRFLLVLKLDEIFPEEKPLLQTPAFIKITKIIQNGIKSGEIRNLDPLLIQAYFFGIINNTLIMVLNDDLPKNADAYHSQAWLAAWNVIVKK